LIDLHCHILPGIDDGATDIAESLAMARMAVADGIQTIVATPHTLNEVYFNPPGKVLQYTDQLQQILSSERIELRICPGSDAHICAKMMDRVQNLEAATINQNGRYLLVEFPVQTIPADSREELFQLKLNRITPIITHPERNLVFQNDLELLYDLVAMGCLVQITAMSVTGELGEDAMECAHRLLEHGLAHVMASDAHSVDSRPPVLSAGVAAAAQILGSAREAEAMVVDRPEAIVAGAAVEVAEPRRPRKKRWWWF